MPVGNDVSAMSHARLRGSHFAGSWSQPPSKKGAGDRGGAREERRMAGEGCQRAMLPACRAEQASHHGRVVTAGE